MMRACSGLKWDGPKGLVGVGRRRWHVGTRSSGTFSSAAHLGSSLSQSYAWDSRVRLCGFKSSSVIQWS